jgi:hypothetical protein
VTDVTAGPHGPALTGTDDEALAQALRNLWPILSRDGRQRAIGVATRISQT